MNGRTIYELCRFYDKDKCSSPEEPKRTNDCIREECVVFEGYLPMELVEIEGLTDEELAKIDIPLNISRQWMSARRYAESVINATVSKIKQQGKLYRRKE